MLGQAAGRLVRQASERRNCWRASIGKLSRPAGGYCRLYPVVLVQPDGSTLRVRHKTPREIVKLPLNLDSLDEQQRTERLALRKAAQTAAAAEAVERVAFDPGRYRHLLRKPKPKTSSEPPRKASAKASSDPSPAEAPTESPKAPEKSPPKAPPAEASQPPSKEPSPSD